MEEITGILYSQIGYNTGYPKRVILRSSKKERIEKGSFVVFKNGNETFNGEIMYWGEIWKSHWAIADFSPLEEEGQYEIEVILESGKIRERGEFEIGKNILWNKTYYPVSVGQLAPRKKLAGNKGWFDCGAFLKEANSHAAMILGLCDMLNLKGEVFSVKEKEEIILHIINGSDYLASLQDKSFDNGNIKGSVVHEIRDGNPNAGNQVIPADTVKASAAFAFSAWIIKDIESEKSIEYRKRGKNGLNAFLQMPSYDDSLFEPWAHGMAKGTKPPKNEIPTRDLLMAAYASLYLYKLGEEDFSVSESLLDKVLSRKVPKEKAEDGLYAHFYEYDSIASTEKAWSHHHAGYDNGATFAHFLFPFIEMLKEDKCVKKKEYLEILKDFAYGYFIPACKRNPFNILPMGVFPNHGLLTFCGLWHGANSIYAHASALANEFEKLFNDSAFREISAGNLNWIAGLNTGITEDSKRGMTVPSSAKTLPNRAIGVSMIHGIGNKFAGSWYNIEGSICNGFDTDEQFEFILEPSKENDSPACFTDEEWITHAGAWLSAISRL